MKTLDELKDSIRAMRQRGYQFEQIEASLGKRSEVDPKLAESAIALCKDEEKKAKRTAVAVMKKPAKPDPEKTEKRKKAHATVPAFGCIDDYEDPVEVAL